MEIHAPSLASETIAHIGMFEIRNTLVMAWLAMAVLILLAVAVRGTGLKLIPGRFQAGAELVVEGLFNFFNSILGDEKRTRKIFPLVATMFLFIMLANWMGILPGVGSITIEGMHDGHLVDMPVFRSMNADMNMTLAFTIVSVITTQVLGFAALGVVGHVGKYIVMPWKKPYVVGSFLGLLELIGEVARLASFSFRLFGNIFAGEVLLMVISALVPYIVPIPFYGLEIFVGFIQALVFSMLTLVFISMAVTPHEAH